MRYPPDHKDATRKRIVEAASRVFRQRGYVGAGVDRLASEAGLTSGAFYGHFRSKEEVLTEVVRAAVRHAESQREAGLDGLAGGDWFIGLLRRYLSPEHWRSVEGGCPMPALVSELSRAGDKPRQAFGDAFEELLARIESKLGDGDEEARRRAIAGVSMAVGGMALARAVGGEKLAAEILAACRDFGAAHMAPESEQDNDA